MKKQKLEYHFHDPNPANVAAEYILEVLLEVNHAKAEAAIQSALKANIDDKEHSA